jgi:formylglycine-generating enzyme required for sulfatase activity
MSAVQGSYSYEMDASYAADFSRDREPIKKRSRHPEYRRKGSAPTRVNGMHCRRNKRWTWGSGRSARMSNLRAFAGCMAIAIAALASNAFAVTVDWRNIGNPGNAAYFGNPGFPSGIGQVNYDYQMSRTETTRGQFAEFLNAVASNPSAPSYVTTLFSGSTNFGITRTLSGGSYVYSATAPTSPISNVSWTMAARYVNWLNNGQPTITSGTAAWNTALNTGAYTMADTRANTVSTVLPRALSTTPGLTQKFFLPSANEWVKAAHYNPAGAGSWNTWQTGVNSPTPSATSVASGSANTAVYNTGVAVPGYAALPVGSVPNTQSPYGLYDMLGNVTEMTDSTNAVNGPWFAVSGNYSIAAANITSWNINNNRYLSTISSANGFRVSGIAPVPEPETITLAAFGIVGLCGANWLKRRRKVAGPALTAQPLAA